MASNHGADKQEFLNAGLSTSHAFGGSGKRSIMQTNQVSIMKTIQSSVMKNPNITQSVMQQQSQFHPINSVIS